MKSFQAGVSAIALLWAGQAMAQDDQAAQSDAEASPSDIIVTAQKRSERLIDVPVSISTVSAESLTTAGQDSLMSLNKVVPGVFISQPVYFLSPTVRGVGSTLSLTNESAVAIYVDGVYQTAQTSNVFDLASVAGVEVLKGPQGTLFGRNATGGAILVRTLDPSFSTEGRFNVSYGRFNEIRANAYVNMPITDQVAANAAVSYRHSDGYIRDLRNGELVNGSRSYTARGKLLLQTSDALEVIFTASKAQNDDPTPANAISVDGINALGVLPGAGPIATDRGELSHNVFNVIRSDAEEYNLRVNFDTGSGTLSSISALKYDQLITTNDGDNTYLPSLRVDFFFKQKTYTQEINFSSEKGGDLSYVVGVYYYNNRRHYPSYLYNSVPFLSQDNRNEALSGYADGTYEIGDLAIIAGIRYSTEKRKIDNALLAHPLIPVPGRGSVSRRTRENAWTPRLGLRYALGDRSNIYATYSRGFKSGAFNGTSLTSLGVTPETIDAFELGYKTAGNGFLFNAAAFYYKYHDIQANTLVITNGVALSNTVNAAKARIFGAEVDATYDVSDALSVHATFAYTNAEYSSFPNAPGYRALGGGAFTTVPVDASGNAMVRQPKYQASAQINYKVPLGDNALNFMLSPSYNSRVFFDFANQLSQKSVVLLDGSVDFSIGDTGKITLFGQNITNRKYYLNKGFSTFTISGNYSAPAMYGVRLSYSFK